MSRVVNVACRGAVLRASGKMNAIFGSIFAASSAPSRAEVGEDGAERDVEAALDEEERCQEGEGDDAQPFLFFAVLLVVAAHDEAEHESRQHGVTVRGVGEHHQQQQAGEDKFDLRLDHAVAVASEEPGCDPWQRQDPRVSRRRLSRSLDRCRRDRYGHDLLTAVGFVPRTTNPATGSPASRRSSAGTISDRRVAFASTRSRY
jgi:hypothetical protein